MRREYFWQLFLICFLGVCIFMQSERNRELQNHIEYLEAYIQENNLPTPAFRIHTDRINIEIGER